jgi:hypothetical protein
MVEFNDEHRLAWAAGFLEGNAFFYPSDDGVNIRLVVTDRVSRLSRFCSLFELRLNSPTQWGHVVVVSGRKAARIIHAVYPYMSIDTKREIREVRDKGLRQYQGRSIA